MKVAQAHFGPHGFGSNLSPQAHQVVDWITWVLIVIGVIMFVRFVRDHMRNRKTIERR